MKNILEIFKRDVQRIRGNIIAMLVILGITVVPCLYAWFNIAASWDPYSNTGALKVAVASVDEGYEGDLIPINLNLGDSVLSALRENTQLDWVFTGKEKALKGVRSGEYYAAIVIPTDFSQKMMSIFSDDIRNPKIIYYYNAKENAIAPKVTDKGASAIQKQVNQVFIETITDTVLVALQSVSDAADKNGAEAIIANLISNLERISSDLSASSNTIQSFSKMTGSAGQMLESTSEFLKKSQQRSDGNLSDLQNTESSFSNMQTIIGGATDGINTALTGSQNFYTQISGLIDEAFDAQSGNAGAIADVLNGMTGKITPVINNYQAIRDALAGLKDSIGDSHSELSAELDSILRRLDSSISSQTAIRDQLNRAADDIRNSPDQIRSAKAELDQLMKDNARQLASVQSDYEENIQQNLNNLFHSLDNTSSIISGLLTQMDAGAGGIYSLSGSASSDLSKIQSALDDTSKLIDTASRQLSATTGRLTAASSTGDFQQLQRILSGDSETISGFLASPVSLSTTELYPIENYGSSMAPFYSVLSIWVGGIVLVAILKVTVCASSTAGLVHVKPYQIYLGRYPIFLLVGLLQSTLICLGDLYYLQIQCSHPFLFLLAGWFSSIVYVNIIYTLTVSFGDIGKAISVILLVMQVAGSGGTFPIETAPAFFQKVYPLLPFTHSMAAMRECIGGMYKMTYWSELGKLGIFLIISLIFGLVLRNPIIRLNETFTEKLEDTHLI